MNNSPYLDRPLLPLAIALPRMLAKIEADLSAVGPAEKWRLRQRAELIRGCSRPDPQAASQPSRLLNRIGVPLPNLRQALEVARADFGLGATAGPAQVALGSLRPLALAARFLHAGADGREIVSSEP